MIIGVYRILASNPNSTQNRRATDRGRHNNDLLVRLVRATRGIEMIAYFAARGEEQAERAVGEQNIKRGLEMFLVHRL